MLSVLGAGSYLPQTVISNAWLKSLGFSSLADAEAIDALAQQTGIMSRRSSLPEKYIAETGNTDPREIRYLAEMSPSDLGDRAIRAALEKSGVAPDQISAIIADCGTPSQICPSEAHRLGSKLGVKVPSFDLFTTTGPVPAHLETLLHWKEERVPEYTVLVATNTPTHRLNYRHGHEGFYFGDGAASLVVSTRHPGKLAVRDAELFQCTHESGVISFDKFAHAIVPKRSESLILELAAEAGRKAIAASGRSASEVKFIGPEFTAVLGDSLCEVLGIPAHNHWSTVAEVGNTLSAGPLITLANHWDQITRGDTVVCVQVGVGLSYGFVILECVQ